MLCRWILARITRELEDPDNWPSNRTDLHISGHASCIAEGLTVPWFFSKLDADNIDYGLFLELSGKMVKNMFMPLMVVLFPRFSHVSSMQSGKNAVSKWTYQQLESV